MDSPRKKKAKLTDSPKTRPPPLTSSTKRQNEDVEESSKRFKTEKTTEEDVQTKKRKNFIKACEIVSYKAYFNQNTRFQLDYLPTCANAANCAHLDHKNNNNIKPVPPYIEEAFKIEMKTNMWSEALEVCILCISPDQYLPSNVLKDIVEIMLNAHDNEYTNHSIKYLINKCQEIFEINFSYHPPCMVKSLRKCYNDFLTSPMDSKENTFTNRSEFGCDKGVVKYCLNRLEHEISQDSVDGPFVDKYENIPEDMKQSVKGLHWQKEKLEIYELLGRKERIERLMAILDSIIELLQFDLAIWHSRYTNNLGSHIMRSHKPLMAYILWSNNVLYTGAVNNNCRQILRLFVYLVHLKYPDDHIDTITMWLNTMIQTFYICENNSNRDYPNTGKYCTAFANEFYKLISDLPQESIIRILEHIKPDYMQCLIGTLHIKKLLSTQEDNVLKILATFIKENQWRQLPENKTEIKIFKKPEHSLKNVKNLISYLNKKCEALNKLKVIPHPVRTYSKLNPDSLLNNNTNTLNYIIHVLYITIEAYLDAYSVESMQETIDALNEELCSRKSKNNNLTDKLPEYCTYTVTEHFVKKYRTIYQTLKELMLLFQKLKNNDTLPTTFKVFEKIGLLGK